METTKIGWIGIGLMGNPMSQRLILADYPLSVYNRSKEKFKDYSESAKICETPQAVMEASDIIFMMVTNDKAVREIFFESNGLLNFSAQSKLIINMSTISPALSIELSGLCKTAGHSYLDAPVSGSVKQAETGELVIMVGGAEADYNHAVPLFNILGKKSILIGDNGKGNVAKLAINGLLGIFAQGLAEALLLAEKNGVSPKIVAELINEGTLGNAFSKLKGEKIVEGNYSPAFSLNNICKDLGLASAIGFNMPMGSAALKTFENASEQLGDDDLIAVFKFLENEKS